MPTLGLAIIARDEEHSLPTLLASVTGAFDHIVLVDTGSTDRTVETFTEWAETTRQPHTLSTFTWVDDFAAARNHAHSLLETDWHCWADADDEIIGAANLRRATSLAGPSVDGITFEYDYDDSSRAGLVTTRRERLVRRNRGRWYGRVHEQQLIIGEVRRVERDIAHWNHRRADWTDAQARNAAVEDRWRREDPFDWRRWDTERALHRDLFIAQQTNRALQEVLEASADRLTELTAAA